jgi:diguanylate cyclase (GGDEF)-like protein
VVVSRLLTRHELLGLSALASSRTFAGGPEKNLQTTSRWIALVLQAHRRIRQSSSSDELTGLFTRRRIEEEIDYHLASAARTGHPVSLAILDLDNFKAINELHDPVLGDEVLREVAHMLRDIVRSTDVVGRIGSDEFAIVLPETGGEEAFRLAHHWRAELTAQVFCDGRLKCGLHASVGLADSRGRVLAPHELISEADKALYEAKKTGGNKVVLAST